MKMTCEGRMFVLLAVIWSGGFWKDGAVLFLEGGGNVNGMSG